MNATELTNFFLNHRGRCFPDWSTEKIFSYVLVNLVHGNVFVAQSSLKAGHQTIALAAIAWLNDADLIQENDALGLPQYDWKGFPSDGDSILIADVAGDRRFMPEILNQVNAAWRDVTYKRLFTWRRGKLVELSWETVLRFCGAEASQVALPPKRAQSESISVHPIKKLCAHFMCGPHRYHHFTFVSQKKRTRQT